MYADNSPQTVVDPTGQIAWSGNLRVIGYALLLGFPPWLEFIATAEDDCFAYKTDYVGYLDVDKKRTGKTAITAFYGMGRFAFESIFDDIEGPIWPVNADDFAGMDKVSGTVFLPAGWDSARLAPWEDRNERPMVGSSAMS